MICPCCGLSLSEEAKNCPRCKTVLKSSSTKKEVTFGKVVLSVFVVLVLLGGIIGVAADKNKVANHQNNATAVQTLAPGEIASDYEAALAYGRNDDPVRWARIQDTVKQILSVLNIRVIPGTHQLWGEVLADGLIEHKEDFRVPNGRKGQYIVHADNNGTVWRVSVEGQVVYDHLNEYKQLTGAR